MGSFGGFPKNPFAGRATAAWTGSDSTKEMISYDFSNCIRIVELGCITM